MLKLTLKEQHELLFLKTFAYRKAVSYGHRPSKFSLAHSRTAVTPAWMSVCDNCHMPIVIYAGPLGMEAPMLDGTCDVDQTYQDVIKLDWTQFPSLVDIINEFSQEQAKRN